jgi:hypothetical protein
VKREAAETCTTSLSEVSFVGRLVASVVPMPSWPSSFLPQHITSPFSSTAQAWSCPVAMDATFESSFTGAGVGRSSFVSSPSWPK